MWLYLCVLKTSSAHSANSQFSIPNSELQAQHQKPEMIEAVRKGSATHDMHTPCVLIQGARYHVSALEKGPFRCGYMCTSTVARSQLNQ